MATSALGRRALKISYILMAVSNMCGVIIVRECFIDPTVEIITDRVWLTTQGTANSKSIAHLEILQEGILDFIRERIPLVRVIQTMEPNACVSQAQATSALG